MMGDMAGSAERNSVQRSQSHPCDLPEQGPADVPDGCTLLVWNFRPRKGLDCPRRSVYATLSNSKNRNCTTWNRRLLKQEGFCGGHSLKLYQGDIVCMAP